MDVNGTRFHLVSGEADWATLLSNQSPASLLWDPSHQSVGLAAQVSRFARTPGEKLLTAGDRRGAAMDRYGNWYWIDEAGRAVRILPAGLQEAGCFWSVDQLVGGTRPPDKARPGEFRSCAPQKPSPRPHLRALTVTSDHYLVVGTLQPAGLLVFDLHSPTVPNWLHWPVPFAPFDMEADADGGFWILDLPGSEPARYWRLDRHFCLVNEGRQIELEAPRANDFRPVEGLNQSRPGRYFPGGISLDMAIPSRDLYAVSLVVLPDESILVLESDPNSTFSVVHRYKGDSFLGSVSLQGVLGPLLSEDEPIDLKGHDMAFLPSETSRPGVTEGALYIVADDGNQVFVFAPRVEGPDWNLQLCPRHLPVRRFGGRALVAAGEEVYFDFEERWLPLTEMPRRRFQQEGQLEGLVFDGKTPDCHWHRVVLDACIAKGDQLLLENRTSNERHLLSQKDWKPVPPPYLRPSGSELPLHKPFHHQEDRKATAGSWETLLQEARGRFLEVRLKWRGSGRSTPLLRSLRVYYPRFSYVNEYLPAFYQDDPTSANFLDRFLANPEGLLTALEGRLEKAEWLLDPRTSPPEFLDWLAGWLGASLEAGWEDSRRRLFLTWAHELFRWRGTLAGLQAFIRLATEPCPSEEILRVLPTVEGTDCQASISSIRIIEHFLRRRLPGVVLGDPTELDRPGPSGPGFNWNPRQGATPLHQQYRRFLETLYSSGTGTDPLGDLNRAWATNFGSFPEIRFTATRPAKEVQARDWRSFIRQEIGFTYSEVTTDDAPRYRRFLARRYRSVDKLKTAYRRLDEQAFNSFETIQLPHFLPEGGRELADWIQFVSFTLPVAHEAHRFAVLVPVSPQESGRDREQKMARIRQIVHYERPAHTSFEVKPFWALFQVGAARVGLDTVVGQGSRFMALVLGGSFLGESYLTESYPWSVPDRRIVGRDFAMEN